MENVDLLVEKIAKSMRENTNWKTDETGFFFLSDLMIYVDPNSDFAKVYAPVEMRLSSEQKKVLEKAILESNIPTKQSQEYKIAKILPLLS